MTDLFLINVDGAAVHLAVLLFDIERNNCAHHGWFTHSLSTAINVTCMCHLLVLLYIYLSIAAGWRPDIVLVISYKITLHQTIGWGNKASKNKTAILDCPAGLILKIEYRKYSHCLCAHLHWIGYGSQKPCEHQAHVHHNRKMQSAMHIEGGNCDWSNRKHTYHWSR